MMQSLSIFAYPGSLLFALLLLALPLSWWGRTRRIGIRLGSVVLALILLIGVMPLQDWLLRPLEEYYPVPDLPAHVDGIIVLGGSERPRIMAARGWPELNSNADRLVAFVALGRRYPDAKLIFTGGGAAPSPDDGVTEADVAARVFDLLGFDSARVVFERTSRNTKENAHNSRALVEVRPGETWLLVTSAAHMPRAVNCFRAVGWSVLPYPVDFATGRPQDTDFSPFRNLASLNGLGKEWLGLIGYRIMGYTDEFLPPRRMDVQKP